MVAKSDGVILSVSAKINRGDLDPDNSLIHDALGHTSSLPVVLSDAAAAASAQLSVDSVRFPCFSGLFKILPLDLRLMNLFCVLSLIHVDVDVEVFAVALLSMLSSEVLVSAVWK